MHYACATYISSGTFSFACANTIFIYEPKKKITSLHGDKSAIINLYADRILFNDGLNNRDSVFPYLRFASYDAKNDTV